MRLGLVVIVVAALGLEVLGAGPGRQPGPPGGKSNPREEAYRANNLGVALLEQFNPQSAVEQFRKALTLDPALDLARINLALALFYAGDANAAASEAKAAQARSPRAPQPPYLLGLIARSANRVEEAVAAFGRVLELDPLDVGANVNLAQVYLQQRRYAEAAALCKKALDAEPYNATAAYNLAMALARGGDRKAGETAMQRFQQLRASAYAVTYSQLYLEQGRYAEAVASTGAEAGLVDEATPAVSFVEATATAFEGRGASSPRDAPGGRNQPAGAVSLADLDGDGDLDLLLADSRGLRVMRNTKGRFADVTTAAGLDAERVAAAGIVAADYDNDNRIDLFVLRSDGSRLYHQEPNGGFRDVTKQTGLPQAGYGQTAAFIDLDHDGDVDLFVPGARSRLLRNNANGTFTDTAAEARLDAAGNAVAIVPTDYDNRRDIDVLLVSPDRRPSLWRNLRDGTFKDVAADVELGPVTRSTAVAAGDVNKDSFTDFFFGHADGPGTWAFSDGRGRFALTPAPAGTTGATAALLVDYDNDGLLDLFVATRSGPRLIRNVGSRGWRDVSDMAFRANLVRAADSTTVVQVVAAGDLDLDGDTDLVARTSSGAIQVWRNEGGSRNRSLRVTLTGRVSNRSAVGSKVEIRAGSLQQKLETSAATPSVAPADLLFGLGRRSAADVVRILWPAGILQAETNLRAASGSQAALAVTELDRKPSSCPYLYTWNGREFEFVTDFLGGGEMGYSQEPGIRNVPDPDEYVRITDDQLRARDGRFELRVTNELEEALFLDQVRLLVVLHPEGTAIYPDEGLRAAPARPLKMYAAPRTVPPLSAVDDHGHDVTRLVARIDGRWPDDFRTINIRGYAEPHTLTLALPPAAGDKTLLLLTGWTDYAFSGDNVAAHHAGLSLRPPILETRASNGSWRRLPTEIGIPVGRPQTLVVELPDRLVGPSREVRIVTNMRIYWDRIAVAPRGDVFSSPPAPVQLIRSELRWRGFSEPVAGDLLRYNYQRVNATSPWKLMPGRYTRFGDVIELVDAIDDMFVIAAPGDEFLLSFDATTLPPPPAGFRRTYLLFTAGFTKEMDLNSASPDQLAPLPFRAMTRYPYTWPERYPETPAHLSYQERYNTRLVPRSIPRIDALLLTAR